MSTEIEQYQEQPATVAPLSAVMDYSRAVSSASMLPEAYRGKPADIMLAVGLGQSMGLSPAESLYRIAVIKGRPTAGAELIASNVRKAGHRLRVVGDDTTCTATIIRADDPEFSFEVTRDVQWAQRMGLANNDNYRKQPGTMLQWRAITAVARLACPEALYGVAHTADEISDFRPAAQAPTTTSGSDRMRSILGQEPAEPEPEQPADVMLEPSSALGRKMFAALGDAGITDKADRLKYVSNAIGREVESSKDMTEAEARQVIDAIEADVNAQGDPNPQWSDAQQPELGEPA